MTTTKSPARQIYINPDLLKPENQSLLRVLFMLPGADKRWGPGPVSGGWLQFGTYVHDRTRKPPKKELIGFENREQKFEDYKDKARKQESRIKFDTEVRRILEGQRKSEQPVTD